MTRVGLPPGEADKSPPWPSHPTLTTCVCHGHACHSYGRFRPWTNGYMQEPSARRRGGAHGRRTALHGADHASSSAGYTRGVAPNGPACVSEYPRSRSLPSQVKTSDHDHPSVVGCPSTPCPPGYQPAAGRSGLVSAMRVRTPTSPRFSSANASAATIRRSADGSMPSASPAWKTCSSSPTP